MIAAPSLIFALNLDRSEHGPSPLSLINAFNLCLLTISRNTSPSNRDHRGFNINKGLLRGCFLFTHVGHA
jgi:hypothetical protein